MGRFFDAASGMVRGEVPPGKSVNLGPPLVQRYQVWLGVWVKGRARESEREREREREATGFEPLPREASGMVRGEVPAGQSANLGPPLVQRYQAFL